MERSLFELDDQVEELEMMDVEDEEEELELITRQSVSRDRDLEQEGFKVRLPKTKGYAIVKILSIEDLLSTGWLPGNLQRVLGDLLTGESKPKVKDGYDAFKKLQKIQQQELELADAMVVKGFIRPSVVAKEEDLDPDREDQILVTSLATADRRSYMALVMNHQEGTAEFLDDFR